MTEANTRILALIDQANETIDDPSQQHQVLMQGDILAMFDEVDLLVTDISSVGLDYLYLEPHKPLALDGSPYRYDQSSTPKPPSVEPPRSSTSRQSMEWNQCCWRCSPMTRPPLPGRSLRRHYFGEGEKGTSTALFTTAVSDLIADRTVELKKFHSESTNAESSDD